MLQNLLSLQLIDVGGSIALGFLDKFIGILIGAVGITGLGIIIYCLILKTVMLPLDIWQKVSMRKQSLKMEEMRGQLEKLQQQYANTPDLYQRKVQEVYKQNGYNMFSSCIPMIVSIVILFVAFGSLTTYSQSMNLEVYKGMAKAYNAVIEQAVDEDAPATAYESDSEYNKYESEDTEKYIYFIALKTDKNAGREYFVNAARLEAVQPEIFEGVAEADKQKTAEEFVAKECAAAAAKEYAARKTQDNEGISFLLTQNIFYPDVAWAHPLQSYKDFKSSITKKIVTDAGDEITIGDFIDEETYNILTSELSEEKKTPNGYFIIVALTILSSLASQLIMMRSQKAQRELQTADATSQSMSKWMMFMMPVLFCIFAFIYSAAFSLYMITSSLYSLVTMVIVNRIIDGIFKKKEQQREIIRASGRQAYTRDWEANARIRAEREKAQQSGKDPRKKK